VETPAPCLCGTKGETAGLSHLEATRGPRRAMWDWLNDLWNDGIADWGLASNLVAELLGVLVSIALVYLIIDGLLDRRERRVWDAARSQISERLGVRLFDWLYWLHVVVTGEKGLPPEYVPEPHRFEPVLEDAAGRSEELCKNWLLYKKLDFLAQESLNRLARFSPVLSREPALVALLQQLEDDLSRWNTYFLYRDANLMRPTDQWQLDAVKGCLRAVRALVDYLWPQQTPASRE